MQSLSLALVLVGVLVTSVPDVLPGSNVTVPPNFGALCQQRYLYPQGYSLDKCGRCVLPADANRTCDCTPLLNQPCVSCPESPVLTGLLLCKLDPTGYHSLPLDSDEIEQAFLDVPDTLPPQYLLYYPGLPAPLSLSDATLGMLDCWCIWTPLGTTTTRTTQTTPTTTITATTQTTSTVAPTTTVPITTTVTSTETSTSPATTTTTTEATTLTSTSASTTTSTTSSPTTTVTTTTAAPTTSTTSGTTAAPTTTPTPPAPRCEGLNVPCTGVCPLTGFDCVAVNGVCGCRLPCEQQSPLDCGLGYCGGECVLSQNNTCVCSVGSNYSDVELLAIISVPTAVLFLTLLTLSASRAKNGMKHKYQQ